MKTQKPLPNPPLQYEPEYMYDLASLIIDEEQSTLKVDRDNVITTGSIIFKDELTDEYYWFGGLNDARQEAMIDISFNLGQTRLRGFKKALDAMSTEDFDRAADEFMDSKWAEQVKSRAPEVTEMIRTGEYS